MSCFPLGKGVNHHGWLVAFAYDIVFLNKPLALKVKIYLEECLVEGKPHGDHKGKHLHEVSCAIDVMHHCAEM